MRYALFGLGYLALSGAAVSFARSQGAPEAGAHLRVRTTAGPTLDGYLVRLRNDTIFLNESRTVPVNSVAALDVRVLEARGRLRWAGYGLIFGAAAASVWCAIERHDCMANSTDQNNFGEGLTAAAAGGGLVGAIAGTIYGGMQRERWRATPVSVFRLPPRQSD